jgi:ATP-dependent DNA helicase DinG
LLTAPQTASAEALGADGPLNGRLPGFVARATQQDMAARIEQAIEDRAVFIAESGTGTGKTLAYLVPAILSGKKILISTGTKALQDQLFQRDLPTIRDALGVPVTTALLKGRANYLCLHRLERAEIETRFGNSARGDNLRKIREWAGRTACGDTSELVDVPEDVDVWPQVTSTPENCLGSTCGDFNRCFVNKARREALAAEILVVNHHLFFAELVLREEGFGQLLPGVEAVIFDEAHQLPEIASNFFGSTVSSQQLLGLSRDSITEEHKEHSGVEGLEAAARRLDKSVADLRLALGLEPRRAAWGKIEQHKPFQGALEAVRAALTQLSALLERAAVKGTGLANCWRRSQDLLDRVFLLSDQPPPEHVRWFETSARHFVLRMTPMDIATPFHQCLADGKKAWIFTSATLAVGNSFSHFQSQLGLSEAETAQWESPFDYATQALLYVPRGLPPPSVPDYTERVVELAIPVLEASRGRAFMLFTSHRALKLAADLLSGRIAYPLLVQGSAPRSELLQRFRDLGNAVLLGTGSFWEGVDVRGEALSTVIIDKLPFASPDDPVLQARGEMMEREGRSAFMEYQLPNAVIVLKQGAGRLIRDVHDKGVLMLCDPRLLSKGYGKIFLASLPPLRRTHDPAVVQAFFAEGV